MHYVTDQVETSSRKPGFFPLPPPPKKKKHRNFCTNSEGKGEGRSIYTNPQKCICPKN